jgi:hypothetical protein
MIQVKDMPDKTENDSMNISLDRFLVDNKEKSRTRSNFSQIPNVIAETLKAEHEATRLKNLSQDRNLSQERPDSQRKLNEDLEEIRT